MANRSFLPPQGSLEVNVCEVFADITIGSTGAPTLTTGKGIASVARSSAGQYLITLSDPYNKLLWAHLAVVDSPDDDPSAVGVLNRIKSHSSQSGPTITFQFYKSTDGTAVDPSSGAVLKLYAKLRNSSVT